MSKAKRRANPAAKAQGGDAYRLRWKDGEASAKAAALPKRGLSATGKVETIHAEGQCPIAITRGDRVNAPVAVNARYDFLEFESARGRLQPGPKATGEWISEVLEKLNGAQSGGGGFEPHGSVDIATSTLLQHAGKTCVARLAVALERDIRMRLGETSARRLLAVLGAPIVPATGGLTEAPLSRVGRAAMVELGQRRVAFTRRMYRRRITVIAADVRRSLAVLCDEWDAHGRPG